MEGHICTAKPRRGNTKKLKGWSKKSDDLIFEFKSFAEKMVENNQKAIIEALQEVIKDFNTKLNNQFGENFKQ